MLFTLKSDIVDFVSIFDFLWFVNILSKWLGGNILL